MPAPGVLKVRQTEEANMAYDPKCYELAEHFLADSPFRVEKETDELARAIQDAVEDWFCGRRPAVTSSPAESNGNQ
jgi:hypothetical protein